MGRMVSRLFLLGHLLVRLASESPPPDLIFLRALRGAAVEGGRRPSRSDLPFSSSTPRRYRGELAIGRARRAPRTCIRPTITVAP
jgi:hypothetical protein